MNGPEHYQKGEAYLTHAEDCLVRLRAMALDEDGHEKLKQLFRQSAELSNLHFRAAQVAATVNGTGISPADRAQWNAALGGYRRQTIDPREDKA
jgi:hypothetical protein